MRVISSSSPEKIGIELGAPPWRHQLQELRGAPTERENTLEPFRRD